MTEIAAANPYAWFPLERSSEELITPTAANRLVGYPYTKYMVSVMDVDMAAALVVASHEKADELGVPDEKRVYLRGWAYGNDPWYVAERPELWRSRAMEEVSSAPCRWPAPASTTWPTSTSTAASPARCCSVATPWGSKTASMTVR